MEVNNRYMASGTYLYLPGVNGNYASTPDAAALDITGDIDLRVKVAYDDWTSIQQVIAKWVSGSNQRSYRLFIQADGKLVFSNSTDGTSGTVASYTSSIAPTVTDGSTLWVRVTLDVDNGSGGRDVIFYTSNDGTNWTQLGTTQTVAGTTSIFNGTGALEVGSQDAGANNPARGKFFRAQVLNGIGGTVAFDADFETGITSLLQTTFTESSLNAATVTINRSGSAYRSAGITQAGYLYPGATNTFTASATDFLNFGDTDSLTALVVVRQWNTPVAGGRYLDKRISAGYLVQNSSSKYNTFISDGTTAVASESATYTSGLLSSVQSVINRTSQTSATYLNATSGTPLSISSVGSLSSVATLTIGRVSGAATYQDFELVGAAVFRTALTATQIRQITNYFANREVYL
jgi:hypothetical protein